MKISNRLYFMSHCQTVATHCLLFETMMMCGMWCESIWCPTCGPQTLRGRCCVWSQTNRQTSWVGSLAHMGSEGNEADGETRQCATSIFYPHEEEENQKEVFWEAVLFQFAFQLLVEPPCPTIGPGLVSR